MVSLPFRTAFSASIVKLLGVLALIFLLGPGAARSQSGGLLHLDRQAPWHIEADFLHFDKQNSHYQARGQVVVTKQQTTIRADQVDYDQASQHLTARGGVTMSAADGDRITADRLEMNLADETGIIYAGRVQQQKSGFYLKGDNIRKTGPDTYQADRVRLSTCDPVRPDWHLSGRDLDVTIDGYGSIWHTTLWAGRVPVFYLPYLFFPAKTRRQTGFLVPQLNYSDRKWETYLQPFYWAINDQADATFYLHHMERRGQKLGLEYRQAFAEESHLTFMYDFFNDGRINDTEEDDRFGYDHDTWLRPNASRYWLRSKMDLALPADYQVQMDLDYVSDQDYLLEFQDGYTGFETVDQYFSESFGRDLDADTATTRLNRLNLNKQWTYYSFNAELRWNDDVIQRRWGDTEETPQRLPELALEATRHQLADSPWYYDLNSEYVYCYRKDGTKGHRFHFYPRFYWPFQWQSAIAGEASVGLHETAWAIDRYQTAMADKDKTRSRELYDVKLDLSSEIYRIFNLSQNGGVKLKHALTPKVAYTYTPWHEDQGDYPVFGDDLDLVAEENIVTYSLTNTFTLRTPRADGPDGGDAGSPAYNYRQVGRLKVEQSYDLQEAREDDPARWSTPEERRPYSPLRGELELRPVRYIELKGEAEWCQYDRRWLSYSTRVNLSDNRGDRLSAEYRKAYESLESIQVTGRLRLNEAIEIYGEHERNLYESEDIVTAVGAIYDAGCWSLDINYTDEPDDRRYMFTVNLHGLGGIGTDVSAGKIEHPRQTLIDKSEKND